MDSLSWFVGGDFILGGMVLNNQTLFDYGLKIAEAGAAVYHSTPTGLGGEYVAWTTDCSSQWSDHCDASTSLRISDGQFKLRPKLLETWYYAYHATKNPKYREWMWDAFLAMNTFCRTATGFSAIQDVNQPGGGTKLDQQESFVLAEVMKYIYLIHIEDSGTESFNTFVFNTEAHIFKVAGKPV